ncbi:hypothetical protein BGW42_000747 [Actinomortierella wolfii]|nr:hypothetical protein BGW42_000747 [Actinomortierella wolfii]
MSEDKAQGSHSQGPSLVRGHSETRLHGMEPPVITSASAQQPPVAASKATISTSASQKSLVNTSAYNTNTADATPGSTAGEPVVTSLKPKQIQSLTTSSSSSAIAIPTPAKSPGLSVNTNLSESGPATVPQRSPGSPASPSSPSMLSGSTSRAAALRAGVTSNMLASPTAIPPGAFMSGFKQTPSHPSMSRSTTSTSLDSKTAADTETQTFSPALASRAKGKSKSKDKDKEKDTDKEKSEKGKSKKDKFKEKENKDKKKPETVASQSVGKPASKKGFTTRFRKLRKRQGSVSRDTSAHAMITSGESDSEPISERYFNNSGYGRYPPYANYMVPFRPQRPRRLAGDAELPPPPPIRSGSADGKLGLSSGVADFMPPSISSPHSNMGIAPFSIVTRTPAVGELSQPSVTERESSSVRFKGLLKRNATTASHLNSPNTPLSGPHSAPSGPSLGSIKKKSSVRGTAFWSDFLSGDDSPGTSNLPHERARSSTARFSVSRLSASGRRKRRLIKKQLQAEEAAMALSVSPHTDDDGEIQTVAATGRTGRRRPHHYPHWFQHLNRHRSRSADNGARAARLALATTSAACPFPSVKVSEEAPLSARPEPAVSTRLQNARMATTDPNTLVAELEPVPLAFKYALQGKVPVIPSILQQKASPTSTGAVNTGVDASGGGDTIMSTSAVPTSGGGNSISEGYTMGHAADNGAPPCLDSRSVAQYHFSGDKSNPLAGKSFLFMAYQNTRFHRFYTFRIQGDTVQYAKLPVSLEQGCLHYFRESSITYRRIEQSAKEFREKKKQAMERWLRTEKEAQLQAERARLRSSSNASRASSVHMQQHSLQQQQQQSHHHHHQNKSHQPDQQQPLLHHDSPTIETVGTKGDIDGGDGEVPCLTSSPQDYRTVSPPDESNSDRVKSPSCESTSSSGTSVFTTPTSPASTASEVEGLQQVVKRFQEFRLDAAGDDPARPRSRRASMDDELISHRKLSMTPINNSNDNDRKNKEGREPADDREVRQTATGSVTHLNIPVVKTPPNDTDNGLAQDNKTKVASNVGNVGRDETTAPNPPSAVHNVNTLKVPGQHSPQQSPSLRHRKRSWSSLREQPRLQVVRQQRMAEEMLWQQQERALCEEAKQATFGLDLFLWEILKNVEYEKFDHVTEIAVTNENRDSTLLSIVNGDRTNHMWLESPSCKQKQEFLNWISVATMGYTDEPHSDSQLQPQQYDKRQPAEALALWMEHKYHNSRDDDIREQGPIDLLLDMTSLKIAELEAALISRRQNCERAMREMEECLCKLDDLDHHAEKLKHQVLDAVGSQEVQKALLPAPNTDKTLAQTVEAKLKDVNDRIVFVTKVMVSARYDLNRLRYEIELEQRSIRLFRQYKIVIGIVTVATLLCLWFLYYQRSVAMYGPDLFANQDTPSEPASSVISSVAVAGGPLTVTKDVPVTECVRHYPDFVCEQQEQQPPGYHRHHHHDHHPSVDSALFVASVAPVVPCTMTPTMTTAAAAVPEPTCDLDSRLFTCSTAGNP